MSEDVAQALALATRLSDEGGSALSARYRPSPRWEGGMVDAPEFRPGELEEACALTHTLFEALPTSLLAETVLRMCMRSRWPHMGRAHLVYVLQTALRQAEWRQ